MRKKNWRGRGRGKATVKQPSPPLSLKGLPHLQNSFIPSISSDAEEQSDINESFTEVEGNEVTPMENEQSDNNVVQLKHEEVTANMSEQNMEVDCGGEDSVQKFKDSKKSEPVSLMEINKSSAGNSFSNNSEVEIENDNSTQSGILNVDKEPETDVLQPIESPFKGDNSENISNTIVNDTTMVLENDTTTTSVIIGPLIPPKEFFESVKQQQSESDHIIPSESTGTNTLMEGAILSPTTNVEINFQNSMNNKLTGEKGLLVANRVSIKVVKKAMPKAQNAAKNSINKVDNQTPEFVKEQKKVMAAQVEYISEYSSDDRKRKILSKKVQEAKFVIKNESTVSKGGVGNQTSEPATTEIQLQVNKITPFPQPMLVDPVQLERETEQYYKEVSNVGGLATSLTAKSKTKCLTPYQIAQIAKNYPASHGNDEASREMQAAWSTLHQYWTHVQENPYDFDGWTYLLNHVESMNNIEAARSAFEGFLPLYPYCFAYWNKLADLELKFSDFDQCLGILFCGAKSVPFCIDLWTNLLKKFEEYAVKENVSDETVRGMYEYAIDNAGLSWHSYPIWELYMGYETKKENLVRVLDIHRRLLAVPTKLYNKNWDQTLALIRDHHSRNFLTVGEYFRLKKRACELLKVTFNPPPLVPPKHLLKLPQPEDKVLSTMKELIVADIIPIHEANEKEVNKRWKYEEKIKRPYFHVKPLEKKQLKTWKEYLDFEIRNGDPVRICSLFERCLVPCAQYEEFWQRYASYMEDHVQNVLNSKYAGASYKPGIFASNEPAEDGKDKIAADISGGDKTGSPSDLKKKTTSEQLGEIGGKFSISMPLSSNSKAEVMDPKIDADISSLDMWDSDDKKTVGVTREIKFEVTFLLNRLSEGISVGGKVLTPPSLTPSSILQGVTWNDVRQIYRRGAWIHCPSKPMLLMQWAEFEESQGNVQTARELLNTVISKSPSILKARFLLIDLERRSEKHDRVEELYAQAFAAFSEPRIKSFIAIRYARFLFKIKEEDEKALVILRKARKKDKANIHLYHHVFDICYQRRPIDCDGVRAAVKLALGSNMSLEEKNWFCIKRSDFIREHGTMAQLKEAQMEELEIKGKFELEKSSQTKADNNIVKVDTEDSKEKDKEVKDEVKNSSKSNNSKVEKDQPALLPPEISTKPTPILEPPQMLIDIINRSEEKQTTEIKAKKSRKRSRSPHHHHKSSKRSRSSRKERDGSRERGEIREKGEIREHKKRSKKSRDHDRDDKERDRERHSSTNSKPAKDTSSAFQEILYAPDGTILYNPNEGSTVEPIPNQPLAQDPNNMPPMYPGQMMQPNYHNYPGQHVQGYPNQPPLMNYPNMSQPMPGIGNDKNYNAMPPTWDIDSTSLPNYGYGASSNIVKDNQNNMYNRYYDLLNQGYKNKDAKDEPNPYNNMNMQDMSGPGRNPNTYLPPPPIPQGILGDSLFNQGSVSNMNRPFGRGDLTNPSFDPSSRPPPFAPIMANHGGPGNNFGRQDGYSAPFHMTRPPPLMSLPVQFTPGPTNQFHDSSPHQHHVNDNMSNQHHVNDNMSNQHHAHDNMSNQNHVNDNMSNQHHVNDNMSNQHPHTNVPLENESNFVSSPSNSNSMNIVPSLTGGMPNLNQQEGPYEDMRNVLNVTSLLKEQRAKENSNNLPEEPKIVSSGRNTINVQALMKERRLSENSVTQGEETKSVSSGRNTINVQALMKEKMMSENSNTQEDETLIVSSGRSTNEGRTLLNDRIYSEDTTNQQNETQDISRSNFKQSDSNLVLQLRSTSGRVEAFDSGNADVAYYMHHTPPRFPWWSFECSIANKRKKVASRQLQRKRTQANIDAYKTAEAAARCALRKARRRWEVATSSRKNTRKENESSSIQIDDSDDDNDSSVKVVSSGRNTINVLALMKGGKLPASVSNPPQNEQRAKEDPRNNPRKNITRMQQRLGGPPTNAENIPPINVNKASANLMGITNQMQFSIGFGPQRSIPPSSANLDCNVPDWLINEGGELRLSSSANGISLLRYWPRYMNEQGHKTLFQSLRKSVKWFQRRHVINAPGKPEQWAILPKLISWVGPCDFEKDGIILNANTNWPPEIVDLLHRLNHFSNSSFNSCFLSLYTNGYAHHPWHTETHTALEKNPTIATISLGITRQLEMKRVDGPEHIRLPLFPGSLCVLEGAAAEDWLCQITKEPEVVEERISLAFRTMLMIKGVTV